MTIKPDDRRGAHHSDLSRFILLFSLLYVALGAASPFLPAFLAARGLSSEEVGILVSLGIVVRLAANPVAGAVADRLHARRRVLTVCLLASAVFAFSYVPAHGFWLLFIISLIHAAALAPTTTLADALALRTATPTGGSPARFEYGWVRGAGSAAFIVGSLASGQAVSVLGLATALTVQALFLAGAAASSSLVPELPPVRESIPPGTSASHSGLWMVVRDRTFRRLVLVAAIILGSHAMHDTFVMIAWNAAGISPATGSFLWSGSVVAEVFVFFRLGPWLLRRISPETAITIAALAAALRWVVLAQTSSVLALALVEPLHGFTFALLHLACMHILVRITPVELAASAQAIYAFGLAAASALVTFASGFLYAELGMTGFLAMAALAFASLPAIWALSRALQNAGDHWARPHPAADKRDGIVPTPEA